MKKNIHPPYYPEAKITCACGQTFICGATKPTLKVEICSHCHPFYTGKEELIDIAGRVEKFNLRRKKSQSTKQPRLPKRAGLKSSQKRQTKKKNASSKTGRH